MAPARYTGGDGARPRPHPAPAVMSDRSTLARGAIAVAVFVAAFAVGNVLGEDERPAAPQTPAKRPTVAVGPLRLEPAPALPGLRAVPARPKPAPVAPAGPGPVAASDPSPGSEGVPVETGGYSAPTQTPPVSSAPPAEPTPAEPAPPSDPEPAPREVPQASAPTPDPAPIPAVPTPDPAPPGGYGPNQGP